MAWKVVVKPKEEGGLGILNMRIQNVALLLKFFHKFYTHADLPWVHLTWACFYSRRGPPHRKKGIGSFWWRDIISLSRNYMMIASCSIGNGLTVSFWKDLWDLGVLQWRFP